MPSAASGTRSHPQAARSPARRRPLAGAVALAVPLATSAPARLSRSAAGNEPVVPAATADQSGVQVRLFERAITHPSIHLQEHMRSAERHLGCSPSFAAQIAGY